jgi:acetyl esterase/lipase
MLSLRDLDLPNLPQPAGNITISPWISIDNKAKPRPGFVYEDCLDFSMLKGFVGDYFTSDNGDEDKLYEILQKPEISPLSASTFKGICPTLVTYGSTEIFQHDNETFIERLQQDDVQVDVISSKAPHIWIISPMLSPTYQLWKTDCTRLADWCVKTVGK